MSKLAERYGPWAVVTGASSGIGAEFARQLAGHGFHIVLVARRRDRLEELASGIEDMFRVEVRVAPVDLTSRTVLETLQPAFDGIEIGLLVNCAGFGTTGPFLDTDPSVQESMIHLNCHAPVVLSHEVAQGMRDRGRGGLIFVSSINGFCAAPGMANYNATKAYDLLFAEGLAAELSSDGIDVQALCPGGTITEFQEVAGIDATRLGPFRGLVFASAASVVEVSLRKLGRRVTVVPGIFNKANVFMMRFLPRWLSTRILGKAMRRLAAYD
ncbi:MAG: SDR family oxidoreductase [Polyangiales bacterium]